MSSGGERFRLAIATCLGLGLSPIAPGTMGALLGVAYFIGVRWAVAPAWQSAVLLLGLVVTCWANHVLTPWAQRRWNDEDPSHFVLDEVAGYLTTVLLFSGGSSLILTVIWTFATVRVLDIIKVPPARRLERIHGPWGILLDDLLSGVYAALLLHALRWWRPGLFG